MNRYNFYDRYIIDDACWEEHDGKRVLVADIIPEGAPDAESAFGERVIVGERDDEIPTNEEPRNAAGLFIKAMDDEESLTIVAARCSGQRLERVVFVGLE